MTLITSPEVEGFPEEAPGARASRTMATWCFVLGVGSFLLSALGTILTIVFGTLALVEARRAKAFRARFRDRYLPLKTGSGLAIVGLVCGFVLPVASSLLVMWPRLMLMRRTEQAQAMETTQKGLGERARNMRERFRGSDGLVNVPTLAQALIQEAGPQPNPYKGKRYPLQWAEHVAEPGLFAFSKGYSTFDRTTQRYVPTLFIRGQVLDSKDRPKETTWVVRLD